MVWNIRKQKTTKQNNEDSVSSLGKTSSKRTFTSQGYLKEKLKSKKLEIYLKK